MEIKQPLAYLSETVAHLQFFPVVKLLFGSREARGSISIPYVYIQTIHSFTLTLQLRPSPAAGERERTKE
jgi:hypothetical protein